MTEENVGSPRGRRLALRTAGALAVLLTGVAVFGWIETGRPPALPPAPSPVGSLEGVAGWHWIRLGMSRDEVLAILARETIPHTTQNAGSGARPYTCFPWFEWRVAVAFDEADRVTEVGTSGPMVGNRARRALFAEYLARYGPVHATIPEDTEAAIVESIHHLWKGERIRVVLSFHRIRNGWLAREEYRAPRPPGPESGRSGEK